MMDAISSPPPHSIFSLGIAVQVLKFRTKARMRVNAFSTPDATWTVSGLPSMLIPEDWPASGFGVV
jgi:hypothetical protein